MNLEDILLNEMRQIQKDKYHMFSLRELPRTIKYKEQSSSYQRPEGGRMRSYYSMGSSSVRDDEKVPEKDSGMTAHQCERT